MKYNYFKKFYAFHTVMILTLSAFILSSCKAETISTSVNAQTVNNTELLDSEKLSVEYTDEDLEENWNNSNAVYINLSDNSINVDGSGATVNENILTISSAGTYVIQGTLSDGQIIINAQKDDIVRLILNGIDITSSNSSAIYSMKSKKTIITLAENTTNNIKDSENYIYNNSSEDEPDAAIFIKDNLTINGSGTLNVYSNYKDGIKSKDNLVITNGTINVTSISDGICGHDSLAIKYGTFNISSGKDGLKSNSSNDEAKGWIYIDGGNFNIISNNDGIQAETTIQINSGEFNIVTGNGSTTNISKIQNNLDKPQRTPINKESTDNITLQPNDFSDNPVDINNLDKPQRNFELSDVNETESTSESIKGIKASKNIYINSGNFNIDSYDDAIHSNDTIIIENGTFELSSGDDAIHSDSYLLIDGNAIINISNSYEGLEAESIVIKNGTIHLKASDDGINSASKSTSLNQAPNNNTSDSSSNCYIQIDGGYIFVDADGDGLDSNGNIYINGGIVFINGPTNNGNSALDYDRSCEITNGLLIATGSAGMMQTPSDSSNQNLLTVIYSETQKAGTAVNISDESGNSILTFTPNKDYQSVIISSPKLELQKTYSISSGGTCNGTITNDIYLEGTYTDGTKLTDVELSSNITTISDNGQQITTQAINNNFRGGGKRERNNPPSFENSVK